MFTDIVGFTEWTNSRGDEAALALLERQDVIVSATLTPWGRIIKEIGDGLLLWFDEAAQAVQRCVSLQIELAEVVTAEVPLWMRIGMHWGDPRWRGADIVGRDVNLAARIAEMAGPGEVLCSAETVRAAGPLAGVGYVDLGPAFLRGFSEPIALVRAEHRRS